MTEEERLQHLIDIYEQRFLRAKRYDSLFVMKHYHEELTKLQKELDECRKREKNEN